MQTLLQKTFFFNSAQKARESSPSTIICIAFGESEQASGLSVLKSELSGAVKGVLCRV